MRTFTLCLLLAACADDASTPRAPAPETPDLAFPPQTVRNGFYKIDGSRWIDAGPAADEAPVRLVIALRLRDRAALEARAASGPHASADELLAAHAPAEAQVQVVVDWLAGHGLIVTHRASNRLLLVAAGTAGAFRDAFGPHLHILSEVGSTEQAYGVGEPLVVPAPIARELEAVLTADLPADDAALPGESGEVTTTPPAEAWRAFVPSQIAAAYGVDVLHAAGHRGQGVRLGVVAGATYKLKDVQSFWRAFGIDRADPVAVTTMEPIATRTLETTLDIQWSGALAPGADVIVYQGPDARDSSLVYTFNEAVALGDVDVLTDSFAHNEAGVPRAIREQYDRSALWGSALGITIVAAAGNSGKPDVPGTSPWVTAVGGTRIELDDAGQMIGETAWGRTGAGESLSFPLPAWQAAIAQGEHRCVTDVALNAGAPYWVYRYGAWERWMGTSFASPVFAGVLATADSRRLADGLPGLGWLNGRLYRDVSLQAGFRDIATGATEDYLASPGWDFPTGWGAPDAASLAAAE